MADKPEPKEDALNWVERRFSGLADYLSAQISTFVAFLFLLFALGAFFGAFVYTKFPEIAIYFIIAPAVLGLIAYYNRTVAVILFAVFIVFFII
ncbi:MAG: hypothetical protein PHD95_02150 [Candidatus ainarchaeum sp.]|nr:hypothetical protein [Candidatus ainarchaeum sp.]